ncbi:MAG: hypothetical protein JSR70_08615 [Proteobacteria bacterium]|nr:hypothetical protein [Pseudomonadota bacterium]
MLPKERFAWVWMTALVIVFGLYFAWIQARHYIDPDPTFLARIGALAIALSTLAVIAIATHLYLRMRRGEDGEIEQDERDRAIQLRASTTAYYVLMAGIIYVGCVLPFTETGWDIVHAALAVIAIAEIVQCTLTVRGYRKG